MELDPIPYELIYLKCLEKISISERIFKKIAIMHGKGEVSKLKGPYLMCPLYRPTYVMFYQGQKILMDLA